MQEKLNTVDMDDSSIKSVFILLTCIPIQIFSKCNKTFYKLIRVEMIK